MLCGRVPQSYDIQKGEHSSLAMVPSWHRKREFPGKRYFGDGAERGSRAFLIGCPLNWNSR